MDFHNESFLTLMRTTYSEIEYLSDAEKQLLRSQIDNLKEYLKKGKRLGYTDTFLSSVSGKVGAINSALIKLGY